MYKDWQTSEQCSWGFEREPVWNTSRVHCTRVSSQIITDPEMTSTHTHTTLVTSARAATVATYRSVLLAPWPLRLPLAQQVRTRLFAWSSPAVCHWHYRSRASGSALFLSLSGVNSRTEPEAHIPDSTEQNASYKPTVAHLLVKFPAFCGTRKFTGSSPEPDQSSPRPPIQFL